MAQVRQAGDLGFASPTAAAADGPVSDPFTSSVTRPEAFGSSGMLSASCPYVAWALPKSTTFYGSPAILPAHHAPTGPCHQLFVGQPPVSVHDCVACLQRVWIAPAAALADDDFADFTSAAPEAPRSPAAGLRDQAISEDVFAATLPAAEHGANGGSGADGNEPSEDAYAVVSAASEAREHGPNADAGAEMIDVDQLYRSQIPAAVVVAEPLMLATARQPEAEDVFAAFSPTNAIKSGTEFDDWGAEEGFGAFETVSATNDVAAKLSAAGVAVSSPKRVTRDWCVAMPQRDHLTWCLLSAMLSPALTLVAAVLTAASSVQRPVSPASSQPCFGELA